MYKHVFDSQVSRYIVGGGISAVMELSLFILFVQVFQLQSNVAHTSSYLLAISANFTLLKFWIFSDANTSNTKQVLGYLATIAINLMLSNALISFLDIGFSPVVAKIVTMAMVVLWNYFVMSKVIFNIRNA